MSKTRTVCRSLGLCFELSPWIYDKCHLLRLATICVFPPHLHKIQNFTTFPEILKENVLEIPAVATAPVVLYGNTHPHDDWSTKTTWKWVLRQLHLTVYSRKVMQHWKVHTEVTSATICKSYSHSWNPAIEGSGFCGQGLESGLFITFVNSNYLTHQDNHTNLKGQNPTFGKVIPNKCLCARCQAACTSLERAMQDEFG